MLYFHIVFVVILGNGNCDFVIDSTAGTISTSNKSAINYESSQSYTLKITASDGVQAATTIVKVRKTPFGLQNARKFVDVKGN